MSVECSVCSGDFDIEGEGGVIGNIGILPVRFCPTCLNGVMEMMEYLSGLEHCDECGLLEDATEVCKGHVEEKEHPNQMNFEKELDT